MLATYSKLTSPDILRGDPGNSVLELGRTECNRWVRARLRHRRRNVHSRIYAE